MTSIQERVRTKKSGPRRRVKRLRDKIDRQLQDGNKVAKSSWKSLLPQLKELEHRITREGEAVADATVVLADDLARALRKFRDRV
jgi:hypothetical protein